MPTLRCLFCRHANAPGAKFCNECGSGLRLQPCERCDAINDRDAPHCHQCGVSLAAGPLGEVPAKAVGEPGAEASKTDVVPTLVDEVRVPGAAVRADQRTSVDRAFEVLERDLATLDGFRAARASEGEERSLAPRRVDPTALDSGEHDLAGVRLQPFWRVRASRPLARPVVAAGAAVVALALAVAGYLRTLPQGMNEDVLAAARTQPAREVAGPSGAALPAQGVTSTATPPTLALEATATSDRSPVMVEKAAIAAALDASAAGQPAASAVGGPAASAGGGPAASGVPAAISAGVPAAIASDEPATPSAAEPELVTSPAAGAEVATPQGAMVASQAPARAARPARRARSNAARGLAVSPRMTDGGTTTLSASEVVAPPPVAASCTAGVAALGLCAREPDAAAR